MHRRVRATGCRGCYGSAGFWEREDVDSIRQRRGANTSGWGRRSLSVHTLIIRQETHHYPWLCIQVLEPLLGIARKSKVAGFPFRSVSLFLNVDWGWGWDGVLEGLRECVEKLEIFGGMMFWTGKPTSISLMDLIIFRGIGACNGSKI